MKDSQQVLVVDDDRSIREMFQDVFSPQGHTRLMNKGSQLFRNVRSEMKPTDPIQVRVFLAKNGREGIRLVEEALRRKFRISIAFVDMLMPGMDGAETSRRIWSIDSAVKIVIITAYSEFNPEDIIRKTGRDDLLFLRKPFDPDVIVQSVRFLRKYIRLERRGIVTSSGTAAAASKPRFVPVFEKPGARPAPSEPDKVYHAELMEFEREPRLLLEECPYCKDGIGTRVPRKTWMRIIPTCRYYWCNQCRRHFLKL